MRGFTRGARRTIAVVGLIALAALCGRTGALGQTPQTQTLQLYAGWNNIAFLGPAQPVSTALAPIDGQYDAIYQFDAASQNWRTYNPANPSGSDFTDFAQGAAYWIHMQQSASVNVGLAATAAGVGGRALLSGWNDFAQVGASGPVPAALQSFGVTYSAVWHWDAANQRWQLFDPTAGAVSDFQTLDYGQAYFIRVVAPSPIAPGPAKASCYAFHAYQPTLDEVNAALDSASANTLSNDPTFELGAIHIDPAGGPATAAPYIPSTVLKAIAWIESSWRQAAYAVPRGGTGVAITSSSCAFGLLQVLTGMSISGQPTPRQQAIGSDFQRNVAAGAQILLAKWNMAPQGLPVLGRRDPHVIEDWYYALWAYHCFGDVCSKYNVHNNPDDPALKWPRPQYASPAQQSSAGAFTAANYPYQELVFGLIANPPLVNGAPLWPAIGVQLPPHGSVSFPVPKGVGEPSAHLDDGEQLPVTGH
jgi:hypothetical protein